MHTMPAKPVPLHPHQWPIIDKKEDESSCTEFGTSDEEESEEELEGSEEED